MQKSKVIGKNPKSRKWILAALMFTTMLAAMDNTIVSTAIPQIVGDLGGFSLFSWVFSIYLLTQTITIPVYGKLADIYGRKPILIIGTSIFLLGSATSAISWNMISLIIFRGLQGLGAGSIMASVNTIAGDIYSIEERANIEGWLSSVWGMAAIMGPTIGGALAEYANWRWIFLINLPIGIVAIILLLSYFKENIKKSKHSIDFFGAILMLLSGTALIFTLMQVGQEWGWDSTPGLLMIVLTVLLITSTIYVERKSIEPIMPKWIWTNKTLIGANLSIVCMGAIMIGPNMYLPVFSQSVLQLGAIESGLILASMSIGWPLASSLSGKLYLHIGFRNTAILGSIIIAIASSLFIFLPYNTSVWLMVIDQMCIGAGFGLLSTPMLVGVQSIVPWSKRGVVTGANMFSRYLGQSLGAAILGGIFNLSMNSQLHTADKNLLGKLPTNINNVISTLRDNTTLPNIEIFLRHSFYLSTHKVYIAMTIIGILALLFLMLLPKKLATNNDSNEH
ncbi:MAG TPA: MDR family MFS transporter [Candidatus Kapabacteria bacterium]|nr:MDR family MFS transporter [Candidatus Kapabacteria bacterium]